jgi:2-haloacid dehalogenase
MSAGHLRDIAACAFDAYGTLYDFNSAAARCRDVLADKAEPLSALWRLKQLQYTWLRSLMGAYAPFRQVTEEALDFASASLGLADRALRDRLMALYLTLDAYPEVAAALERLAGAGLRLAILSNGSPDMLGAAAHSSGLDRLIETSLSADAVGVFKPDRRVYQLACDHFKLPPRRIAFISSNGWDAHGGAHFGFASVWLNRTAQQQERLPGGAAIERRTLADLPALLGIAE